jgi:Mor family transcriptional regulator
MEDKNSISFLADLADQVANRLRQKVGMSADAAAEIGLDVADDIRRMYGGVAVYVCKTDEAALSEKYEAVWQAWRRDGFHMGLCRDFDLSEQRIRQIVAVKRRENRQKAIVTPLLMGGAS